MLKSTGNWDESEARMGERIRQLFKKDDWLIIPAGVPCFLGVTFYFSILIPESLPESSVLKMFFKWLVYFAVFDIIIWVIWLFLGGWDRFAISTQRTFVDRSKMILKFSWHKMGFFIYCLFSPVLKLNLHPVEIGFMFAGTFYLGIYYAFHEIKGKVLEEISSGNELADRSRGAYDNAIGDYDKALELNPKYTDAYKWRGSAYGSKGEFGKALDDFNMAIKLDPLLQPELQREIDDIKKLSAAE